MSSIKSSMILAFGLSGTLWGGAQTAMAASAPPLSEVRVLKVQSTSCGIENIAQGQEKTQCDHAGPNIRIYVLEIGYGRLPTATLDGFEVDGVRTPVCAYANGNLTECSGAASKIVGNLYTFDLAGRQEGTFTFSNTSINAPGNTMSAQLYIK